MKRGEITKIVLSTIAAGGFVVAAASLGNTVQLLKPILRKSPAKRQAYYVSEVIKKLRKQGLIVEEGQSLILTDKGHKILAELEINDNTIKKPRVWDRKFRIIIFDITEDKKKIRNAVRHQLQNWGFCKLQDSVWVHPYDCTEEVTLLKLRFGLAKDVLYLVADQIENDEWLRKEYGLK